MKIKVSDRLILFSGSLLSVAAGVALFLLGLQNKNALYAVLAVVLAAFGGYLITNVSYREEDLSFEAMLSPGQAAARRSVAFSRLSRNKARRVQAGEPLMAHGRSDSAGLAVTAPVSGETVPMNQIPDVMFSSGVIGSCVGILPENGQVLAPCDGVVTEIADTNHALTFRTNDGTEILLLVGIDTFMLNGDGLCPLVGEGEAVKAGQNVLEADLEKITQAGLSPIIITVLCS